MTETRKRKAESVEDLDARIAEMETELEEIPGTALSWDEVTSTTADELAHREQRRGMLPKLIRAARVKRLELERHRCEEEAASLRQKVEATYQAFQEQEDQLRQAKEKRDAAHAEWALTLSALQSADERTKRTDRELRELKEGGR
jgi:hypothetical protein